MFKRSRCGRPGSGPTFWMSAADLEGAKSVGVCFWLRSWAQLSQDQPQTGRRILSCRVLGTVPAAATPCFKSAVTSCPSSDCRSAPAKPAQRGIAPDQEPSIYISDSSSSDRTEEAVRKRQRCSHSPPDSGTQHPHHKGAQQHSDDAQLEAMLACKAVRWSRLPC